MTLEAISYFLRLKLGVEQKAHATKLSSAQIPHQVLTGYMLHMFFDF